MLGGLCCGDAHRKTAAVLAIRKAVPDPGLRISQPQRQHRIDERTPERIAKTAAMGRVARHRGEGQLQGGAWRWASFCGADLSRAVSDR